MARKCPDSFPELTFSRTSKRCVPLFDAYCTREHTTFTCTASPCVHSSTPKYLGRWCSNNSLLCMCWSSKGHSRKDFTRLYRGFWTKSLVIASSCVVPCFASLLIASMRDFCHSSPHCHPIIEYVSMGEDGSPEVETARETLEQGTSTKVPLHSEAGGALVVGQVHEMETVCAVR